jgi:prevent-host-death family protein
MSHESASNRRGSRKADRNRVSGDRSVVSMSSTEAQNGFGHLLEEVAGGRTVFVTRRNAARAVVMSVERYRELTREAEPDLDELTAEFDALLERMQSPQVRTGLRAAFRATPDELARAAVSAAREGGR